MFWGFNRLIVLEPSVHSRSLIAAERYRLSHGILQAAAPELIAVAVGIYHHVKAISRRLVGLFPAIHILISETVFQRIMVDGRGEGCTRGIFGCISCKGTIFLIKTVDCNNFFS